MGGTKSKEEKAGHDVNDTHIEKGNNQQTEGGWRLFDINNNAPGGGPAAGLGTIIIIIAVMAAIGYTLWHVWHKRARYHAYKAYYRAAQDPEFNFAPMPTHSPTVRRYGPPQEWAQVSYERHNRRVSRRRTRSEEAISRREKTRSMRNRTDSVTC